MSSPTTVGTEPEPPPLRTRPRRPVVAVATWSARHRWAALLLWIAFLTVAVVGGGAIGTKESDQSEATIGASAGADKALDAAEFGEPPTESVLVRDAGDGPLDTTASAPVISELQSGVGEVAGVAGVSDPILSQDGTAQLLQVWLDPGEGTEAEQDAAVDEAAQAVQQVVTEVADAHPELQIGQSGEATIDHAINEMYDDDLARAELLSIPVTLGILVVVFGALIAAGVPILLALSSVAGAMGLSAFASHVVPSNEMLASVVLLVGMAVGIDYSLFYIRRDREERARGDSVDHAIAVTAATSGRAVVVSGATVMIAMAGMFLAGFSIFSAFAMGTILVVAVAVLGSVTVLPAMLSILGRWVDRPRIPLLWRLQHRRSGDARFWPVVVGAVVRRPALALTAGVAALAALATPALGMALSMPDIDDLADSVPEIQTYQQIGDAFPAEGSAHTVAVWSTDGSALDPVAVENAVADLTVQTDADPMFATRAARPEVEFSEAGDTARVSLAVVPAADDDQLGRGSLEELRRIVPDTLGALPGAEAGVTGDIANNIDFRDQLSQRLPLVIGFVLMLTVAVLIVSFRSVTIALTAAALTVLSVGAAYGLLVLVFQHTWAEGLLGFTSNGAIVTWLPLFLFVILFGLSMDYHVFVVSRIREGHRRGLSTNAAITQGISSSAGVVTSAALVMVAVFSIFATMSPLDFKQLGVGLAAAILIDATIVRAVLLPAAMALLGERNWWAPRWIRRLPSLER